MQSVSNTVSPRSVPAAVLAALPPGAAILLGRAGGELRAERRSGPGPSGLGIPPRGSEMHWDTCRWPDEDSLVRAAAAGDWAAREALFHAFRGSVERAARRFSGWRDDRLGDLCQEAWIRVFQSLRHWKGQGALSTWIWRVVRNTAVDELRKAGARPRLDGTPLEERLDLADGGRSPTEALELKEKERIVRECLQEFPESWRRALAMRLDDYTYEEIAAVLDAGEGQVAVWLHRLRKRLARKLHELHPELFPGGDSK